MNKMDEVMSADSSNETNQEDVSNVNKKQEIFIKNNKNKEKKIKSDVEMEDDVRERKTSGYFIHEFISRNGWNVEKLPTFHHLHISELTHGVLDFQDKMHSEFVRQWRRVVTGDPDK